MICGATRVHSLYLCDSLQTKIRLILPVSWKFVVRNVSMYEVHTGKKCLKPRRHHRRCRVYAMWASKTQKRVPLTRNISQNMCAIVNFLFFMCHIYNSTTYEKFFFFKYSGSALFSSLNRIFHLPPYVSPC